MSKLPVISDDNKGVSAKKKISITRDDLLQASNNGVISAKQAEDLWSCLSANALKKPGFDLATLLWYSGSVVIMLAMGWFMGQIWDLYSGGAIVFTAAAYATVFILIGRQLWKTEDLRIPGGLLFTLAVTMAPLVMFGLEKFLGGLSTLPGTPQRLLVEGSLVVAGITCIRFIRFPFLTAPISFGLWMLVVEATDAVAGRHYMFWGDQDRVITLVFGLLMLAVAYLIDRRTREDFSFWVYLVGATAFWWALTLSDHGSQLDKFIYCLINIGLMLVSVLLNRRVFVVYGALGVVGYLAYLTWSVFENSALFPIALSVLGLAIIFLGVKYQRNREAFARKVLSLVPDALKSWLPDNR